MVLGDLNSSGPGTWTGTGHVICSFGSEFTNNGTLTIQNDSVFDNAGAYYGYGYPGPVFVNNGSLIKNTTTGTTTFSAGVGLGGVAFNNNGSVNLQSGSLSLGGGGASLNGSYTAAAGSVVDFTNGLFSVGGNQALAGGGMERVSGGTVTFNFSTNTLGGGNTFAVASGSIGGTNTFAGAGTVNWSGGTVSAQVNLQPAVALNITGADEKDIVLGDLNIGGPGTWTGTGHVICSYGSEITNNGAFTIQNDSSFDNAGAYYGYGYPGPVFVNNGSLIKNTTTGTTTFSTANGYVGVAFINNGTVNLKTGTLAINGDYAVSGSPQLKLVLGGLNPGTQFSRETFANATTLGGTLSVTLTNGFAPTNGQSFAIVDYGSASGQFALPQLPPLAYGLMWSLDYGATALTLRVVPQAVLSNARLTFNGHFLVTLTGPPASSAVLWASPDLINWSAITTNASFSGSFIFDDPWASAFKQRFYRVSMQQ
jgi:hypothetical protein